MTAAAVAKEKAQLYAEFARLKANQVQGLAPSELQELEGLRHRQVSPPYSMSRCLV
jgi:hypothetical protein